VSGKSRVRPLFTVLDEDELGPMAAACVIR